MSDVDSENTKPQSFETVLALLQAERDICRQLLELSALMHQHVQEDAFDQVPPLVEQRAVVIQQLQSSDSSLRELGNTLTGFSTEEQAAGREIAQEIAACIEKIATLDRTSEQILQDKKHSVLQDLQNLSVGKSLEQEYRSAERGTGGSFVDVRE
jgi:hypothetical protein